VVAVAHTNSFSKGKTLLDRTHYKQGLNHELHGIVRKEEK
jgi:hypothetical protein